MEIRERVTSGIRAIALLIVSITVTATVLVALFIDTLAAASLSASPPLHCAKSIHPVVQTLEFIEDC